MSPLYFAVGASCRNKPCGGGIICILRLAKHHSLFGDEVLLGAFALEVQRVLC